MMTYSAAITKLEELALAGSSDLVRATDLLPALTRQQVYRMIHQELLPAVRIGEYKTTKAIAVEFFKRHIRVNTKAAKATTVDPNRAQEIEDARKRVFSTGRKRG
jgi:hypothetical protein